MKLYPETRKVLISMKRFQNFVYFVISKSLNLLQYVYVVRKSSCCTLSPAHLKFVEDMKSGIEQTYVWQLLTQEYCR